MLDELYDLLDGLSDRPFIRAYENGREPEKPFFTYELKFEHLPEHFRYSQLSEQCEQTITTHVDAILELNYFGEDSLNTLRNVCMRLSTAHYRDKWELEGVSLIRLGRMTHLAFLNEQQEYEDRAMVELEVRYTAQVTDILNIIEQVEITDSVGAISDKTLVGVKQHGKD